jgi:hypothetical protein
MLGVRRQDRYALRLEIARKVLLADRRSRLLVA